MRQAKRLRMSSTAIILNEDEGGLLPKTPLQYHYLKLAYAVFLSTGSAERNRYSL